MPEQDNPEAPKVVCVPKKMKAAVVSDAYTALDKYVLAWMDETEGSTRARLRDMSRGSPGGGASLSQRDLCV